MAVTPRLEIKQSQSLQMTQQLIANFSSIRAECNLAGGLVTPLNQSKYLHRHTLTRLRNAGRH